eukprot:5146477-Pleurochrysis_carterae.AAC.1
MERVDWPHTSLQENKPSSPELTRPKRAWLVGMDAAEAGLARRTYRSRSEPSSSELTVPKRA